MCFLEQNLMHMHTFRFCFIVISTTSFQFLKSYYKAKEMKEFKTSIDWNDKYINLVNWFCYSKRYFFLKRILFAFASKYLSFIKFQK